MGNLASTDIVVVLILIAVIFILMGIIGIIDILNKKRKNEENLFANEDSQTSFEEEKKAVLDNNLGEELPPASPVEIETAKTNNNKHIEEIRYVEEDEELEKTKAKIELERLKEELIRQEEQKQQEKVEPVVVETQTPEPVVQEQKAEEKTEVVEIANAINDELIKEEIEEKEADLHKVNAVQEDLQELLNKSIDEEIALHEDEQEKKAIISVEEFNKISDSLYDNNEQVQMAYEDEGNEPITIDELYNTREMKTVKLDDFNSVKIEEKPVVINEADIKKLEDLPPIALEKKFKSSPFISPVFGISETKDNLELEQTANLEKLNDEIKKTNEFLKTLKELQKNLD